MFRAARWRLVAWNVIVLSLVLAVLEIAVYGIFSTHIYTSVDQELAGRRSLIVERLSLPQYQGNPALLYYSDRSLIDPTYRTTIANAEGQVDTSTDCLSSAEVVVAPPCPPSSMTPSSQQGLHEALFNGNDIRTDYFRGKPQRVLSFLVSNGIFVVQISRSVQGEVSGLRQLGFLLLFGGLLGVVVAAVAGLFLANRALVPIRQAFARQRQFTADASHELRTPLSLIRANAEMLARDGSRLPGEDVELVGEIIEETDRLNRLVGDLLTLARADAQTLQLQERPLDLRTVVEEVHEDLERIAEAKGISSTVNLDGPVNIHGDPGRLRQLLLILLDNALKYTDAGGRVDIGLQRTNGHAHLTVSDTGVGIPAEDLPHIFERFYRVDQAREHEGGGTGLGLAIAKWIVQAHHGTIKVDSQPGTGTRFEIDLPAGSRREAPGT
jgi:two-component system, OmpR family, sensor histidine kinase CiaH